MSVQIRLLKLVLVYKGRLILAGICGALMALCQLLIANMVNWFTAAGRNEPIDDIWIVKKGLEYGLFTHDQSQFALILMVCALLLLIYIPNGLFTYFNSYLVESVTSRIGADLRAKIYNHVQTLPLSFFHKSKIGHIMSLMSYDVQIIQLSSQVVSQSINGPLLIIGGLVRMFMLNWQLAVFTIFFAPFMGIGIDKITKKIKSLTSDTQSTLADVTAVVEETIRGVRIVKTFGMEEKEIERFKNVNNRSLNAALRFAKRNSLVLPAIELMGAVASALVILAGGYMLVSGIITFPVLMEFTVIAFLVANSVKRLSRLNVMYQQTIAVGERMFSLLDTKSDLIEKENAIELGDSIQGKVEFKDVEFEYCEGEKVLDGLSFVIEPGQVVAIVGPSGAGKSTIADLVPRFYDVSGGKVLVDGYDVRDIKIASLRKHIAMVPQETILFSGTIEENIAYGMRGASKEQIIEAAKSANAHEFIISMPDGYETQLGEGGVGLSGGQRQRISIARALLKNPRILILDEATSSLDAASEGIVQEALERLMIGRSTLVIAHRLSTVKNADKILVLDNGKVIQSGTFDELVDDGKGMFSQLYKTQVNVHGAS
ncbi:MAG: ABC transporter ATP-binding protein [Armatimonadota bacterium]